MRALKIEANTVGKRYALVDKGGSFAVYAECRNYSPHVLGGVATTWRFCEKGLSREAAEALLSRKLAGRRR